MKLIEVWGEKACFTNPILKTERFTYKVITPSAACGLLRQIYWHPGMDYKINKIYVLSPFSFLNVKTNELASKIQANAVAKCILGSKNPLYINAIGKEQQQRNSVLLQNVHYVIDADVVLVPEEIKKRYGDHLDNYNIGKFLGIIEDRLKKGKCHSQPYLGIGSYPAFFREWKGGRIETAYQGETIDLGLMLYGLDYSGRDNPRPMYFNAIMKDGVIDVGNSEVLR